MELPPENQSFSNTLYLDFLSLVGLLRFSFFEVFEQRKYWNERYFDLFLNMLIYDLKETPVTLEDLTGFIEGVSYSTKMRMLDEARKDGIIYSQRISDTDMAEKIESIGARKIFHLSDHVRENMIKKLDEMIADVDAFTKNLPTKQREGLVQGQK